MAKKPAEEPEAPALVRTVQEAKDYMGVTMGAPRDDSKDLRFQCLELAVRNYGELVQPAEMVKNAQAFYDFVKGE